MEQGARGHQVQERKEQKGRMTNPTTSQKQRKGRQGATEAQVNQLPKDAAEDAAQPPRLD